MLCPAPACSVNAPHCVWSEPFQIFQLAENHSMTDAMIGCKYWPKNPPGISVNIVRFQGEQSLRRIKTPENMCVRVRINIFTNWRYCFENMQLAEYQISNQNWSSLKLENTKVHFVKQCFFLKSIVSLYWIISSSFFLRNRFYFPFWNIWAETLVFQFALRTVKL